MTSPAPAATGPWLGADPPAAPPDETTARILDAALERFELVGLRRTTVDDVARCAGVGRVTVYRRIGGKEELARAVALREVRGILDGVALAIAGLEDADERAVAAFVSGVAEVRRNRLLRRLLETEPEDILPFATVDAAPLLDLARSFLVREVTGDLVSAEVMVRLAQSFALTPEGPVPVDDADGLRAFARGALGARKWS